MDANSKELHTGKLFTDAASRTARAMDAFAAAWKKGAKRARGVDAIREMNAALRARRAQEETGS